MNKEEKAAAEVVLANSALMLAVLRKIHARHKPELGICEECGKPYPCQTSQDLHEGLVS